MRLQTGVWAVHSHSENFFFLSFPIIPGNQAKEFLFNVPLGTISLAQDLGLGFIIILQYLKSKEDSIFVLTE